MASDSDGSNEASEGIPEDVTKLPQEVEDLLGQATNLLIFREFDKAIELLKIVITKAPKSPEPLHKLGIIYEELGQPERAANSYVMAAMLSKRSGQDYWHKAANIYREQGLLKEAIYCYKRDLMRNTDTEVLRERAM